MTRATATPFTLADLDAAAEVVYRSMAPTPQLSWPLLSAEVGTDVWVKHENHTPIAAFKVRGGLVHLRRLQDRAPGLVGVVSATWGNHGQSLAFAGRALGVPIVLVVPHGNNPDKNDAMRALGAQVMVDGRDFEESRQRAATLADRQGLALVPAFHPELVLGVATYARELFAGVADLDAVYVPVGMGSGIAGLIAVRDLLGLPTEIVGVVAAGAPAYALSVAAGAVVGTDWADTFVDGVACRQPDPAAVEIIRQGAARVVPVPDERTAAAMRTLLRCTHNLPEPAGALALAGLRQERDRWRGRRVAVVLSGGNVDAETLRAVLDRRLPS